MKYPYKTEEAAINEARKEAKEQGFIGFEGQNCNDLNLDATTNCHGWDGESGRCDCGNRRVYWEVMGSNEIGYMAFALAY